MGDNKIDNKENDSLNIETDIDAKINISTELSSNDVTNVNTEIVAVNSMINLNPLKKKIDKNQNNKIKKNDTSDDAEEDDVSNDISDANNKEKNDPSFLEIRFPETIAYGYSESIEYNTDILTNKSGVEFRNINWSRGRMKYNITNSIQTREQFKEIIKIFRLAHGRGLAFRFKDHLDYYVKDQFISKINNKKNQYELVKTYVVNSAIKEKAVKYKRLIKKPVLGTVILKDSYGRKLGGYSVDHTKGIIKFLHNMYSDGSGLYADFEFDVPVRFDTDFLNSIVEGSDFHSFNNLVLVEVKL